MYNPIPADILEQTWKASAAGGGIYITRHGLYTFFVTGSFFRSIPQVGRCFITQLRVLEAEKNVVLDANGQEINEDPHPVGYEPSYVVNYDGRGKLSADSNAKALILTAHGYEEGKVDEATFKSCYRAMVSDAQPIRGLVIRCVTFEKGKRASRDPNTGEFTDSLLLPRWISLGAPGTGENTVEKMAARRSEFERMAAASPVSSASAVASAFMPTEPASQAAVSSPVASTSVIANPLEGWWPHPQAGDPKDPFYYNAQQQVRRRSEILAGR